jgi:hypothetical protein
MNLFTVIIEFEDRSAGIEQYLAESPEHALLNFVSKAESLEEYDRNRMTAIIKNRITQGNLLTHIANEFKGFWSINFGADLIDIPELSSIFGGYIVQTDNSAPKRKIND